MANKDIQTLLNKLDKNLLGAKNWNYEDSIDLEFNLFYLWKIEIEQYEKYKRLFHSFERKKSDMFEDVRVLCKSDLATTKLLNKKFSKEYNEVNINEDYYKVLKKYYEIYSRIADKINSNYIRDLAEAKRQENLQFKK